MARRRRTAEFFALERNTIATAGAMFLLSLGENLWRRFVPKYLEAFGAPITAIGLFGTTEDLLDGVYQYPGGWVADRYGRRRALVVFISLAALGYVAFAVMTRWWMAFPALALVMAWDAMASPTLFAVVGDTLPKGRRTMGFTVQSVLRRIPIMIAPAIGGMMIASYGVVGGIRRGLLISVVIAALTLLLVARVRIPIVADDVPTNARHVWKSFPADLRWLLASDVFIRTCEAMVDVFLVIFAVNVVGISATEFGILIAIQSLSAILVYIPAARIAERIGKKPFVIATFVAFSAFPLAVVLSRNFAALVAAFVIGGLREVGEPARKALILDLASPSLRARVVGLYYFARSVAIAPAAFIGGLLWKVSPSVPFFVATAIGGIGVIVFAATVREEQAG
jgi:MFS family permease